MQTLQKPSGHFWPNATQPAALCRALLVPLLVAAAALPMRAELLTGTLQGPDGATVAVQIRIKNGTPQFVDLTYSPVEMPAGHGSLLGDRVTRNGVDGYDIQDHLDESETLTSHLRFLGLRRSTPKWLRGTLLRDETTQYRNSGVTTYFQPLAGGATEVIGTDPPTTDAPIRKQVAAKSLGLVNLNRSVGKNLWWSLGEERSQFSDTSQVGLVDFRLRQIAPRKWRAIVRTVRGYFDVDVNPATDSSASGTLRAR